MAIDLDRPPQQPPESSDRTQARAGSTTGRRVLVAAWLVPLLLVVVAGSLRFYRLDHPERIYFDETYYAEDAATLVSEGVEEGFVVHPPLGKWIIGAGIAAAGEGASGWRASPAVLGTATVLLTYLAGLRLFRRRGVAALGALLVAVDGLAFTMSRISMLDAILAFFVVLGFWLLLIDRDRQWQAVPDVPPDPEKSRPDERRPLPHRGHTFRWLAGLALGLGLATKWSGLLAIGAAGLWVLGTELAFRHRTTGRALRHPLRIVGSGVLTLLVVPAVVYMASYAGWFANFDDTRPGTRRSEQCEAEGTDCTTTPGVMLAAWYGEQGEIADFHADLDTDHQYRASAWSWPAMLRPVAYYYENCTPETQDRKEEEGETCAVDPGNVEEILGIGNPAVWWLAIAAYPVLAFFAFVKRDWRALAIATFLLGQYVPWLFTSRPVFLFYVTPMVPFIALALTYAAWRALRVSVLRWVPAAVAVLAVVAFVYFYPVFAGLEIPDDAWRMRMWSDRWI